MTDGDREAARLGRGRRRGVPPSCSTSTPRPTAWPTTWSATRRCGSCTTGSTTCPTSPTSTRLRRRLAGVPPGQRRLRRRRGRHRPQGGGRAGAGLPPVAGRPRAGRAPARPGVRALRPHALRHAHLAAGAADGGGRGPAHRPGRPHAVGFHTERWAADFRACCREVLGPRAGDVRVAPARRPRRRRPGGRLPACAEALAAIDELVGDRRVVARSDRIELSKNILRGFLAFDDLLDRYPSGGAGDVPGLGVPVAHRRARLPPLHRGGRRGGGPDQRAVGRRRLDPDRLRHPRRLPVVGGRAAPGRRAAGQPHP